MRTDVILLLALGSLWRLLWIQATIERDEGSFAYVAWTWLRGGLPYVDATTYPGPVTYILYGIPMALFGNTMFPIRIVNDLLFLASLVFIYQLGSRWWGRNAGVAAGLAYVFYMNVPVFEGFLAMSESLLAPSVVCSMWTYQRYVDSRADRWLVAASLSAGIGTLTKLSGGFGVLLLLVLVIALYRRERAASSPPTEPRWTLARPILIVASAAAVPALFVVAYYAALGALGALLDIQLRTAEYVTSSRYMPVAMYLIILAEGAPIWVFGAHGFRTALRRRNSEDSVALLWLAFLLVPTLVPPSFGHYYLQIGPAMSLLAGLGVVSIPRGMFHVRSDPGGHPALTKRRRTLYLSGLIALFAVSAPFQVLQYPNMNLSTSLAYWDYADSASFADQTALASYLADHMGPGETVLVHGWSPEIYWLAGIPAPTKDVWSRRSESVSIPPERYQEIVDVVRFGGARYAVLFGNSWQDLFDQQLRDPVAAYILQDYYFAARIGRAWVFGNSDGAGRTVRFNLALEFENADLLMGESLGSAGPVNDTFEGNSTFIPRPELLMAGDKPAWSIVQHPLPSPWAPENRTFVAYRTTLPSEASMEIAIALAAPSLNPPSGVRFEVLVQPSNGTTATVFQATIDSSQSQRGTDWLYFEIPLDAFEGQVVRIALTTSTTEATTASTLAALWAAPRIMSAE